MALIGSDVFMGDGYWATVMDILPHPTDSDLRVCMMYPRNRLKEAYHLDDGDPQRERSGVHAGCWKKVYREKYIIPFDHGERGITYMFLCDWNGNFSRLAEKLNLEHLQELRFVRDQNSKLKLQVAMLMREAKKVISQPMPYVQQMKKEFMDLHSPNTEGGSRIPSSQDEEGAY